MALVGLVVRCRAPVAPWPLPSAGTADGSAASFAPPPPSGEGLALHCMTEGACGGLVFEAFDRAVNRMKDGLCVSLPRGTPAPARASGEITGCWVTVNHPDDTEFKLGTDESYTLVVDASRERGCEVVAETVFGAMHAFETLGQLCFQDDEAPGGVSLVQADIQDAPRFPFRGVLLDTGRHFLPVETLLKFLDTMAMHKMNVFHWHIVDQESFPVQSERFPELAREGAYDVFATYSKKDMQAVVAYARARGIRVMPEFDIPGHGAWGFGKPELMGCDVVLDPTKPAVYDFLRDFLLEMGEIFDDEYLFLGGDEVDFACWDKNPEIAKWMSQEGMNSTQLFNYFWGQVSEQVLPALDRKVGVWISSSYGTEPFGVVDMAVLPDGSFANSYQDAKSWESIVNRGFPAVISGPYYLDQTNPVSGTCTIYRWDQTWKCMYKYDPLDGLSPDAVALVQGLEAAAWGEAVSVRDLEVRVWPRASAVAERMWTIPTPGEVLDVDGAVEGRLKQHRCRLNLRGIEAGPIGADFCVTDLRTEL